MQHAADELPAELDRRAAVTILGAAHYWADRAKQAEAELAHQRRRVWLWRVAALVVAPPGIVGLVLLWIRG